MAKCWYTARATFSVMGSDDPATHVEMPLKRTELCTNDVPIGKSKVLHQVVLAVQSVRQVAH